MLKGQGESSHRKWFVHKSCVKTTGSKFYKCSHWSLLKRLLLYIITLTRGPATAEKADRTALFGIAMQHADRGYSRRGIFKLLILGVGSLRAQGLCRG